MTTEYYMEYFGAMSAAELVAYLSEDIAAIQAQMDEYDERAAIHAEARDDGKTTTQRAIEALQRPERFAGEHDVARAWIRMNEPHARIFSRLAG